MANNIQSPQLNRWMGFDLSRISMARVWVAAAMLLFLAISSILLQRRWSGAFADSLSSFGFTVGLILAGLICLSWKWVVETTSPRLSDRANQAFAGLVGFELVLFTWSVFPLAWNWPVASIALCEIGLVGWFCFSRRSVSLCGSIGDQFVLPIVVEFFGYSTQPLLATSIVEMPIVSKQNSVAKRVMTVPTLEPTVNPEPRNQDSTVAVDSEAAQDESFLKFADYSPNSVEIRDDSESGEVTSTLVRRIETNGDDILEAHATAKFASGTRQTVLHVPFTPAFGNTPQVECEVADGSGVRLKVGAIFPYGVRLELKRSGVELDELSVNVDLFAVQVNSETVGHSS